MGRIASFRLIFAVIFVLGSAPLHAGERERIVESVLPSLDYGPTCWSQVTVQNLGDRSVVVDIESHRASGALVALEGLEQMSQRLNPGERATYRLEIKDETGEAWVKLREKVPSTQLAAIVALSGTTECIADNQLRTSHRDVAFPMRDPWFSGDLANMHGNLISMVNTSERPARASLCYSSGNLYSVPTRAHPTPDLMPICSSLDIQVPPFGSMQFPVERDGNSEFSIKTRGESIVLEMLHPVETGVKVYSVDSTIQFGGEAQKPN